MKSFLALTISLLLILTLASCGDTLDNNGDDSLKANYFIEYNGVRIDVGVDAQPTISQLGSYTSEDGEACGTDEKDVIYTLSGIEIETHVKGDNEVIRLIKLLDDSRETPEGITIGSSRDEVVSAYGKTYTESSTGTIKYNGESSTIEFHFNSSNAVTNVYIRMK